MPVEVSGAGSAGGRKFGIDQILGNSSGSAAVGVSMGSLQRVGDRHARIPVLSRRVTAAVLAEAVLGGHCFQERMPAMTSSAVPGKRRLLGVFASLVGMMAAGLVSAPPASADCSGPSMSFSPQDVDRGGEVTVTGEAWGDNCYDTGPPPNGEGALGRPTTDIEIILTQDDTEWVLGTVDADKQYGFEVQMVVPADASPGDAQLHARKTGTAPNIPYVEPRLRISDAPAITPPSTTAPKPAPPPPESTTVGQDQPNPEASRTVAPWLIAVAAALVVVAAVVVLQRKSV